jgi:hypothetical protein
MFFVAGRKCPIALTATVLVFGSFGHAHSLEQQQRNWNRGVIVVAQAETPSNSCARERTACLGAHVRKGMFGSEYVPPEDTARCQAEYQACLSGQQQSVQQPATRSPSVDINGAWGSNIGVDYQITQTGNSFRWIVVRGIQGETGNGSIDGNKVRASWSGPRSSGSAAGVVVVAGRSTRIEWSNGVVFLKR